MDKGVSSTPGFVLMAIGALVLLWFIGKLLGASFFFIAAVVIVFLIILITYLIIRLYDEPLTKRIRICLGIPESRNEEEK